MLFEDFKADPKKFFGDLENNLEVKIGAIADLKRLNSSLSKRQIKLIRTLNLWKPLLQSTHFGRYIFNLKIRFIEHTLKGKTPFRIDAGLRERLKDHYLSDNKSLMKAHPEINGSGNFEKHYCS